MTQTLQPLTLPLRGSRLIEASAGTGKTWTIAALYLRLVLGHGTPDEAGDGTASTAPPRALLPSEILVMTFTRAATRELSDRIRQRLNEAARCFRDEIALSEVDDFLRALHADYPDAAPRREAAYRLALAAEAMDDAAVHTIDAWCQRMLREHAFDSANLFDEELEADEAERREQAVHDYWRSEVYPLQGAALDAVLQAWRQVEVLHKQVAPLLTRLDLLPAQPGRLSLNAWWEQVQAQRAAELAALKVGWVDKADAIEQGLNAALHRHKKSIDGRKLQERYYKPWLAMVRDWASQPEAEAFALSDSARKRLAPAGLDECVKDGAFVDWPDGIAELLALQATLDARPPLSQRLLSHAAAGIAARLDQLKRRAGRFGFADLQERLDAALATDHGEQLRERIRAQFPVVLVDEFQDTSPLQYRLFDRLYRVADNDSGTALFLIGDPKQAIYSFRGADIYSYLAARDATTGRHYVLGTNFRSTKPLVAAVNTVFKQAEDRDPALTPNATAATTGAFALGLDGKLALPFEPVEAKGRPEQFQSSAGVVPALTLQYLPEAQKAGLLQRQQAQHAAAAITALLNDRACGFAEADQPFKRLQPSDVAVLVRDRFEAAAVRRALRQRGVASVYLSDQDSVFAGTEAADLLRWLQAVASPRDAHLARAAYASATLGLSLEELAAHVHDEAAWEARLAQLQRLRSLWQRQGVLSMIRASLHELHLPARWLMVPADDDVALEAADSSDSGERRLTNMLHLGELLQAASAQVAGEQGLIRWLAEQIAAGAPGDERIVRLESDARLVQVVTVHKSKGLEYPLVFLPFAQNVREVSRRGRQFVEWADADGSRALDFGLQPASLDAANRERLREDLRLFYVALTRARHALWLGVGLHKEPKSDDARKLAASALGHLLNGGVKVLCSAVEPLLQAWCDAAPGQIVLQRLDASAPLSRWERPGAAAALVDAPVYAAEFERRWGIASFSGLVRDLGEAEVLQVELSSAWADGLRQGQMREELRESQGSVAMTAVDDAQIHHRFPRGALPGNFLHEQLQWLAEEGWGRIEEPGGIAALTRRCERAGHGERAEGVVTWLQQLLATPLPPLGGSGVTLADVSHLLPEMEFWMPAALLRSAALDALCRQHLWPGVARPVLAPRELRGLLMGFADLVFEHDGRYWVMDYKSNHLGDGDAAYHPAALQAAMLTHRYELQAAIYQLALHRLLRARLGEAYDPATQLGGAIYYFLRGHHGPAAGCVHLPVDLALLDALDGVLDDAVADVEEGA